MIGYRGLSNLRFEAYFATMPLHAWMIRGRRTRRAYLELKRTENLSRDELVELQSARLREIVAHAYSTSSYYRERLHNHGVRPQDIRSTADLSLLPFLSKDDVRDNLENGLLSDAVPASRRLRITTSGSTGRPFTMYADQSQLEMRFASTLRALEWTGWRFGDRQARLWHQTLGMSRSQVIREHIDAWFMKRLFVPAFEISPNNIEHFVERIRRHDPVLVDGYAESLNFLATYVRSGRSAGFTPKAIMSSAQALPDNTRKIIESGFATQVFDKYGSREFSGIAYECSQHRHHHVVDECYILELLVGGRPAVPGEVGEIVITDLFNRSTPMIRYRIGDLAVAVVQDPCGCGRHHSQIGQIEGRTQAIVHCANGSWLPGTFFAHFFKDHEDAIRFFQIDQREKGSFTLKIVRNEMFDDDSLTKILESLREYIGDTVVDVELVDEIPLVRTGKRSPVVSTVTEDFQSFSVSRQIRRAHR